MSAHNTKTFKEVMKLTIIIVIFFILSLIVVAFLLTNNIPDQVKTMNAFLTALGYLFACYFIISSILIMAFIDFNPPPGTCWEELKHQIKIIWTTEHYDYPDYYYASGEKITIPKSWKKTHQCMPKPTK